MEVKGIAIALVLGTAATIGTFPAAAATVQITITGTVSSYQDIRGLFGPSGANLAGQSFTATFVLDPSQGRHESAPSSDTHYGGIQHAATTALVAVNLTIGSSAPLNFLSDAPEWNSTTVQSRFGPPGAYNYFYVNKGGRDWESAMYFAFESFGNSFGHGPTVFEPFSYVPPPPTPNDFAAGVFSANRDGNWGYLQPTFVTVGPADEVSQVPLPAALPLFLGGVGAMAWAARRRKQKLEAA